MRYLLAPAGSEGDVRPLVALAKALQETGHEVLLGASENWRSLANQANIAFCPMGLDERAMMTTTAQVKNNTSPKPQSKFAILKEFLDQQVTGLIKNSQRCDIIIGAGLLCTGSSVAEKLGIPYRHVTFCSQVFPSQYHPPYTVPWQRLPKMVNKLLWGLSNAVMLGLMGPLINGKRKQLGLTPLKQTDSFMRKNVILAMDKILSPLPPDAEVELVESAYWSLDITETNVSELNEFIDKGDAPVYIGFGSMVHKNPSRSAETIFKAIKELGLRAIIASGWADFKIDKLDSSIFVCSHVPHHIILPKVKAIVHHGGAGSTWSSARAGVPQVAIPHMLDQFYWAERINQLGVGPCGIAQSKFNQITFQNILCKLTTTQSYCEKAKHLGNQINERHGTQEALKILGDF